MFESHKRRQESKSSDLLFCLQKTNRAVCSRARGGVDRLLTATHANARRARKREQGLAQRSQKSSCEEARSDAATARVSVISLYLIAF